MPHPQDEHIAPFKIKNDPEIANAITVGADSRVSELSSNPQGITRDPGEHIQDGIAVLCFEFVEITKSPSGEKNLSHAAQTRVA